MGNRPGDVVGIIYGNVESTRFNFAANDPNVKRLDYVSAEHPGGAALCQIVEVHRHSQLSLEDALSITRSGPAVTGDYVSCGVRVIGHRDERGLLQMPRTPFKAGTEVRRATANLIQRVLGLTSDPERGAYLGFLKGTESPVVLDINNLVQKHASVLAKTGAGKSYTVGVLIEELLKRRVPLILIDPHGEYVTLESPNIEPREIDNLIRFNLKPKSFAGHVVEYALEKARGGRKRLELDGTSLEAREIHDLLPGKLSPAQAGILYQAVNDLKRIRPQYAFRDIIEELSKNPSTAKWPLVSALENLESTGLFSDKGTAVDRLVVPGQATIINLKGAAPEVQEVAVARLAGSLFDHRKKNKVPPFMFVVEEAHNFCPERAISSAALSGQVLRTVASEGRKFGMGLLIVSQRPAKVDKSVLSQCHTQIIMKVTNPNDLKALSASVEGLTHEAAEEIQRLDIGVALVAGPNLAQPILVEVRTRQTRHGGHSVDVLGADEEEEEEPEVRTLPPSPMPFPPPEGAERYLREAVHAPADAAGAPLAPPFPAPSAPKPRPWSARTPAEPPLVEGEVIEEAERPRPPAPPRRASAPFFAPLPKVAPPPPPEPEPTLRVPPEPDEVLVQRVLTRIGYATHSSREAVARLKELAKSIPEMAPEDYVSGFARIGRTFCYASHPECGPCPLLRACRLGLERLARNEIREGHWGRPRR